jgi:hypothetical protein
MSDLASKLSWDDLRIVRAIAHSDALASAAQSNHRRVFANIGGFLTGLILGFTGLRQGPDTPDGWAERTIMLPAGWTAIEIDLLWISRRPMRLVTRQGETAVLEPLLVAGGSSPGRNHFSEDRAFMLVSL